MNVLDTKPHRLVLSSVTPTCLSTLMLSVVRGQCCGHQVSMDAGMLPSCSWHWAQARQPTCCDLHQLRHCTRQERQRDQGLDPDGDPAEPCGLQGAAWGAMH